MRVEIDQACIVFYCGMHWGNDWVVTTAGGMLVLNRATKLCTQPVLDRSGTLAFTSQKVQIVAGYLNSKMDIMTLLLCANIDHCHRAVHE